MPTLHIYLWRECGKFNYWICQFSSMERKLVSIYRLKLKCKFKLHVFRYMVWKLSWKHNQWCPMKEKYSYCEHCHSTKADGELLSFVDYWEISDFDGRRICSYWIVCNTCYNKRHEWCDGIFPDNCEICSCRMEYSNFCLERDCNLKQKTTSSNGLLLNESCRIICEACCQKQKSI